MDRSQRSTPMSDLLAPILDRKRRENLRRARHRALCDLSAWPPGEDRGDAAVAGLRRAGQPLPRIIAEVKFASPSEGAIRPRTPGEAARVARAYVDGGASALSVLCDRAGFGGSPLELRRIAAEARVPVLFKEFVLDPLQIDLARAVGASLVLLLVRALSQAKLAELVERCRVRGLEPVVEAADEAEVQRALDTGARVVGVNARDLSTFRMDPALAVRAIESIPQSRVAVYMSGVSSPEELSRVSAGRADAVLIGTALMRAPDPGQRLAELLRSVRVE